MGESCNHKTYSFSHFCTNTFKLLAQVADISLIVLLEKGLDCKELQSYLREVVAHILHYSDNAFPTLDATALHPIEEAIYST